MGSPSLRPSYSASQLSPRKPLWTHRTTVLPFSRPSTMYSNAWNEPSSPSGERSANRVGGSQAVTVASMVQPGIAVRTAPPACGSIALRPMNQASTPGPVAMASQTSSGVASTSISLVSSNGCAMSGLLPVGRDLWLQAGMDGHDHAMLAPAVCGLVMVFADQAGDRRRQLLGEGRAVGRRGEPDLAVHGERGELLAGPRRTGEQLPDLAHQPCGERDQPPGRQPVGRAGGGGLHRGERRR